MHLADLNRKNAGIGKPELKARIGLEIGGSCRIAGWLGVGMCVVFVVELVVAYAA
jgi:hypothetical protein